MFQAVNRVLKARSTVQRVQMLERPILPLAPLHSISPDADSLIANFCTQVLVEAADGVMLLRFSRGQPGGQRHLG